MQHFIDFSGRSGRGAYGLFAFAFAVVVLGLAAGQSNLPFTLLMSTPWQVLGRSLDDLIQIRSALLDGVVSVAVSSALLLAFVSMTIRRLRDIGQSPWWTLLVILSGLVVPAMIALSFVPSADDAPANDAAASMTAGAAGADERPLLHVAPSDIAQA